MLIVLLLFFSSQSLLKVYGTKVYRYFLLLISLHWIVLHHWRITSVVQFYLQFAKNFTFIFWVKNCAFNDSVTMNPSKSTHMGYPHVEPPQYSSNQPPPPSLPPQYTPNPVIMQPSNIPPPTGNKMNLNNNVILLQPF